MNIIKQTIPSIYSLVNNPFVIDSILDNYDAEISKPIINMVNFARDHIPNYNTITTYPNNLEYNPNTNGVINFSYAFANMKYCKDTIGSIMNRFDWNSCTDISWTFHNCYNLTGSIPNIPNGVTNMYIAFCNCSNLTGSIPNIPNSVTDMSGAFDNCSNLTGSIPNIPNSVTDMSSAFLKCYNLTGSIPNIPNSVTDLFQAFHYCYNLTGSIPNIPNSVTNMCSAFMSCRNLTGSIPNIPNSVTNLFQTFYSCYNLTGSIPNIPNGIINMSVAFYNCRKLSSSNVYIHSNNITNAYDCFNGVRNTMNIFVHESTTTYNSFYKAMGNSTYNATWNCYLKTF